MTIEIQRKFVFADCCFLCKDARDDRPLTYPGRVLMPAAVVGKDYFWKKSGVLTNGRTESVKQMASKDMRTIEDCNASALPSTTAADGGVRGAAKSAQIGGPAASKVLTLLIEFWLACIVEWVTFCYGRPCCGMSTVLSLRME